MVVISDHFYHYDCPEGGLSKCPITFLVGKHFDRKYMIRGEKIHEIQLKHQEDWRQRSRYARDMGLDIGYICVGQQSRKSRWENRCKDLCPCMDCGGSWVHQLEVGDKNNMSVQIR